MRVGVMGTGQIAHENVTALQRTGRVQIVALCNRTLAKGEAFARIHGLQVPVYENYMDLLSREKMDAVLINTPHGHHCEAFLACCEAGVNIMVEKPLATTQADGERMAIAAKQANIDALVCHTQRYLAPMLALRDFLECEEARSLGALRHIRDTVDLHYFHQNRPAWFFDPLQAGGGLLLNHGVHQIDRLHVLMGRNTERVYARLEPAEGYPALDGGYQVMGRAGEATYTMQCGGYYLPQESVVQLTFERGSIRMSWKENGLDRAGLWLGTGKEPYKPIPCHYSLQDMYVYQFEAMLDALEGKPSDAPTLAEACAVMRTVEAVRRSSVLDTVETVQKGFAEDRMARRATYGGRIRFEAERQTNGAALEPRA